MGENNGQGMKVQSRCAWDEDTDDVAYVSFKNDAIFVVVVAFAVYLYWASDKSMASGGTTTRLSFIEKHWIRENLIIAHSFWIVWLNNDLYWLID